LWMLEVNHEPMSHLKHKEVIRESGLLILFSLRLQNGIKIIYCRSCYPILSSAIH
jgi:hypothetical protein